MKRRGASREAPLRLNLELSLVIQLQSELDLSRIVGSITRRSDLAKACVCEIARPRDGDNPVAAEVGRVEIRVIENIEDLRTELHAEALGEREILEDGEVQSVESGPVNLGMTDAQHAKPRQ